MAYATAAQFIQMYDKRVIGDLVSDANARVSDPTVDANVLAALDQGTEMVRAAVRGLGTYTDAQIADVLTTAWNPLTQMTCDWAMAALFKRRYQAMTDAQAEHFRLLQRQLDMFRRGEFVLDVPAQEAAQGAAIHRPTETIENRGYPQSTSKLYPPFPPPR